MTTTMTLIAKQTVGASGASSVTFSNIPQTYTDLKVVWSVRKIESGGSTNVQMRFNGSTSSYSQKLLYGLGSGTPGSASDTSEIGFMYVTDASQTANVFASTDIYIPNYASTTTYKSVSINNVTENNATSATGALTAALWSSNSAITSIYFQVGSGASTFAEYSTFYLYGISSDTTTQNTSIPYALGGDVITTDGTYWYHAFKSSGSFTPIKDITADVLVVAGGGGAGGFASAGGGGAGGLLGFTSQSLASKTSYTCTVGAGGTPGANTWYTLGLQGGNSRFGTLTEAIGGGGGRSYNAADGGYRGGDGGSGGGGGSNGGPGGNGTAGQGNNGGYGLNDYANGGGGGGAGTAGSGPSAGQGSGAYSAWGAATSTGVLVSGTYYFAGGGNARDGVVTNGATVAGVSGKANTGQGAGSTYSSQTSGGSGIIIVRYAV